MLDQEDETVERAQEAEHQIRSLNPEIQNILDRRPAL